jgi:hypothetical protein
MWCEKYNVTFGTMKRFAALLVLSTVTFTAPKALADLSFGGTAANLTSTTTSSDLSSTFAGYITVISPGGVPQNFFWGGSSCSSITPITATQFQILSDAVINKKAMIILYKSPSTLPCITGFTI